MTSKWHCPNCKIQNSRDDGQIGVSQLLSTSEKCQYFIFQIAHIYRPSYIWKARKLAARGTHICELFITWPQNGIVPIVKYKIERWWSNWRVSAAVKEWQSFWNASTLKNNPLSMTLIKIQSIILLGSVNNVWAKAQHYSQQYYLLTF